MAGLLSACSGSRSEPAGPEALRALFFEGKLAAAEELGRKGLAAAGPAEKDGWRVDLAEVLIYRGNRQGALDLMGGVTGEAPAAVRLRARLLSLFARRESDAGAARAGLEAALGEAKRLELADLMAEAETYLSRLDLESGAAGAALTRLSRAAESATGTLRGRFLRGTALVNTGRVLVGMSRWDEASSAFEAANAIAGADGFALLASAALSNLSTCYAATGQLERAIGVRRHVMESQREGQDAYLMNSYGQLGVLHFRAGQFSESVAAYAEAAARAEKLGDAASAALWLGSLATAHLRQGRADSAAQAAARALEMARRSGRKQEVDAAEVKQAEVLLAEGKAEEATQALRRLAASAPAQDDTRWMSLEVLGSALEALRRPAEAARQYEAALDVLHRQEKQLSRADSRVGYSERMAGLYRNYVNLLTGQGKDQGALRIVESNRARVLEEGVHSLDLARVQALLGRTVALSFWLAPGESSVWLVTRDTMRRFRLPAAPVIVEQVRAYRQFLESSPLDPLTAGPGQALFQTLLGPVLDQLPVNPRVIVVPDGALHDLNFETLVNPAGGAHYWLRDATVSIAPSLAALTASLASPGPGPALLVGDTPAVGSAYPRLEHAARELRLLPGHLTGRAIASLTGTAATVRAYAGARPGEQSILHFAAHAVANREVPLDSGIVLAPGDGTYLLRAREIMTQPLRADLVTLSACRGAGAKAFAGEGLVGLTWAFQKAGARTVIAGLWDVGDASTADLMAALYDGIARGETPAQALRTAKLGMISRGGPHAKPYYWAPFQVFTRSVH